MEELYKKLPGALIPWYRKNARDLPWRKTKEPYPVWLSEIMLQQTRVEAVKGYYERFLKELPTIKDLAEVNEDRLLKLWEGLGYYNRARNLQKAAQWIINENNGVFPSEYHEILSLAGVGEYTAGAIASNCFNEPVAAVDGNVLRVVCRITENGQDISKAATKRQIKIDLEKVYPSQHCGDFTQSLMELGAIVCLPAGQPKCEMCPASAFCLAHKNGTEQQLPVKNKKTQRKIEDRTIFLIECQEKLAIRKRPGTGLLAALWEFPNDKGKQTAQDALERVASWGCQPFEIEKRQERKHVFSHIEWHMICYHIKCKKTPPLFKWVEEKNLAEERALPTAFRQFLDENGRD